MTIKEKSCAFAARSRAIDVNCKNKLRGQNNLKSRLAVTKRKIKHIYSFVKF